MGQLREKGTFTLLHCTEMVFCCCHLRGTWPASLGGRAAQWLGCPLLTWPPSQAPQEAKQHKNQVTAQIFARSAEQHSFLAAGTMPAAFSPETGVSDTH